MLPRVSKKILRRLSFAVLLCLAAVTFCHAETKPGFFRVEQRQGVWWFITPDGKPFFSNGVNVISKGQKRESYNPKAPEYAAFRFYPSTDAWVSETLKRLASWNFNTIGGWSSREIESRGTLPYTKALHLGGSKFVPWGDMFSPAVAAKIDADARREIGNLKDDKNLIGYFSDNELGWWDDTVFWFFLKQAAANKTKQVLIKLLRAHYANDFSALRRDFDTGRARSFTALEKEANLTLIPDGGGAEVIDKFIFLVAQRYYRLAHDAIRRYDPNHLILGDRYPSWYSQSVVRAAIPYVDVVSTNYMADWTDGNISNFYLDTLHRLTNKPIIVTEYYMSATENRSGNKNSSAGFPVVQTQKERAESFRHNLTAFTELPYVIGAHWFQYMDEPATGRADGEDYNMGLVDINDQPYEDLTAAAANLNTEEIHARSAAAQMHQPAGIPRVAKEAEKGLRWWNKIAAFVPAISGDGGGGYPFADCYAAWDQNSLYLAVYAIDFVEPRIYARDAIPESERMTWTINLGANTEPLEIRFGAGTEPKITGAALENKFWNDSTRATMLIKLPASLVNKTSWQAGDKIRLQAKLTSHSRAETMLWNRDLTLAETE